MNWSQQQALVMHELETLKTNEEKILQELAKAQIEIAMLKVKSGIWGALGAGIVIGLSLLLKH